MLRWARLGRAPVQPDRNLVRDGHAHVLHRLACRIQAYSAIGTLATCGPRTYACRPARPGATSRPAVHPHVTVPASVLPSGRGASALATARLLEVSAALI